MKYRKNISLQWFGENSESFRGTRRELVSRWSHGQIGITGESNGAAFGKVMKASEMNLKTTINNIKRTDEK